jgi:hypothetical protein
MDDRYKISGTSTLVWAVLTLLAFVLLIVSSASRGFDLYDISRGVRAISDQAAPLAGGYFAFGWSGAALIFMVVAINGYLLAGSQSYLSKAGAAFGLIAGALFLIYGLVGGHGYLDLSYVQSVRSADYIRDAYLPLTIVSNQLLAAALTVSGLWLALTNWHFLRTELFSPLITYLGLAAGAVAVLGFVMPAGLFGLLSLTLGVLWGILVGLQLLRRRTLTTASPLP